MPSTATITSFYTFTANTKARASQANTNFSNYRGHLLSIEPLTATSSHELYDLGAIDKRWRTGYLRELNLSSSTLTAGLIFRGDASIPLGAYRMDINSVTVARFDTNGIDGSYMKALSLVAAAMADNSVVTRMITDANVTSAKCQTDINLAGNNVMAGSHKVMVSSSNESAGLQITRIKINQGLATILSQDGAWTQFGSNGLQISYSHGASWAAAPYSIIIPFDAAAVANPAREYLNTLAGAGSGLWGIESISGTNGGIFIIFLIGIRA